MVSKADNREIPLTPEVIAVEEMNPKMTSTIKKVLKWLGEKKCRIDLKRHFKPRLKLIERKDKRDKKEKKSKSKKESNVFEEGVTTPFESKIVRL